jgi:hypothetical protein
MTHDPKQSHDVLRKDNALHAQILLILSMTEVSLSTAHLLLRHNANVENSMTSFAIHPQMVWWAVSQL